MKDLVWSGGWCIFVYLFSRLMIRRLFLYNFFFLSALYGVAQSKEAAPVQISPDEMEAKIRGQKNLQLIDTRTSREFCLNHIPDAVNIDLLSPDSEEQLAELDRGRPVFIYSINAGRSVVLAKYLLGEGYTEVYVLAGGIANWIGSGKPYCSSAADVLSYDDFLRIILGSAKPVLVEVGARWCPSCAQFQPTLDSVEKEYGDSLTLVRIDLYSDPALVSRLEVHAVPTLILYRDQRMAWRKTGTELFKEGIEKGMAVLK